jgi:hypothetical protein
MDDQITVTLIAVISRPGFDTDVQNVAEWHGREDEFLTDFPLILREVAEKTELDFCNAVDEALKGEE